MEANRKEISIRSSDDISSARPLSTTKPKFDRGVFYKIKIKEPFAQQISRADAKLLFGHLGEYENPLYKIFEVLCRPGAEVKFGTACAVHWGGSLFKIGIVETRRPDRTKTYRVRFLHYGRFAERTIVCERVFPIVAVGGWSA